MAKRAAGVGRGRQSHSGVQCSASVESLHRLACFCLQPAPSTASCASGCYATPSTRPTSATAPGHNPRRPLTPPPLASVLSSQPRRVPTPATQTAPLVSAVLSSLRCFLFLSSRLAVALLTAVTTALLAWLAFLRSSASCLRRAASCGGAGQAAGRHSKRSGGSGVAGARPAAAAEGGREVGRQRRSSVQRGGGGGRPPGAEPRPHLALLLDRVLGRVLHVVEHLLGGLVLHLLLPAAAQHWLLVGTGAVRRHLPHLARHLQRRRARAAGDRFCAVPGIASQRAPRSGRPARACGPAGGPRCRTSR